MGDRVAIVLDIGKTMAKASLWNQKGILLARESRANERIHGPHYRILDAAGIEKWLVEVLSSFARKGRVTAIIPVAHGAAAAIIRGNELALPPMDYETEIPLEVRHCYSAQRDTFAETGSPEMEHGLNLGIQLEYIEHLNPGLYCSDVVILPWAQYWAWLLSGIARTEITSLGAHTDLWCPSRRQFSNLAVRRGWAAKFAPFCQASEAIGCVSTAWTARTGLPEDVLVYAGLHDSNAALLAARALPDIGEKDATIVSTGTWFVSMRSHAPPDDPALMTIARQKGCLVNVDVAAQPVPTALFMGGREVDLLAQNAATSKDAIRIDAHEQQQRIIDAIPDCIEKNIMVLPTFVPGTGPFPQNRGHWINLSNDPILIGAAIAMYIAFVTDAALRAIGANGKILIDGRFAKSSGFASTLASIRPDDSIMVGSAENDVAFGALRLIMPQMEPKVSLKKIAPLKYQMVEYLAKWQNNLAGK